MKVENIDFNKVNSLLGTTGPGIPGAMKKRLEELQIEIQDDADTFFGKLEGRVEEIDFPMGAFFIFSVSSKKSTAESSKGFIGAEGMFFLKGTSEKT